MDKIIDTFRPFLDQTPTLDIVPTKLGWIMVQAEPLWVSAAHIPTEKDLLEALAIQFIEGADGDNSREDARLAWEAMAPLPGPAHPGPGPEGGPGPGAIRQTRRYLTDARPYVMGRVSHSIGSFSVTLRFSPVPIRDRRR